jgi:hypothetical protein
MSEFKIGDYIYKKDIKSNIIYDPIKIIKINIIIHNIKTVIKLRKYLVDSNELKEIPQLVEPNNTNRFLKHLFIFNYIIKDCLYNIIIRMQRLVVVYGFENEWKIYFKENAILCKSIYTNRPVYAAPCIIEDTNINCIIYKIKEMELTKPELFHNIIKLAKMRREKASWKIVLYSEDLKFKVGYESEGDEYGDGR